MKTQAELDRMEEIKQIAMQNIASAAHEFFLVSPRYCELKDKQRNGAYMDADESQELRWLEVISTNLNLYLGK